MTPAVPLSDRLEAGWDPEAIDARYEPLRRAGASLAIACAAPLARLHYAGVDDPLELAACVLRAVNAAHALIDGNKRAAISLADEFLGLVDLRIDGDQRALAECVWSIAANPGSYTDAQVAERLRVFVHTGAGGVAFAERMPMTMDLLAR